MPFIRTLLVLFAFAAGAQAAGAAEAWRIVATTGAVKAGAAGVMPVAINTKQTLPADSWIETAATGRIVLTRGLETIAVGPNSRVMLPALPVNGNTQVLQTVGTALYQIGKQKAPHFQVDTPYLAAVVKGTTFTVSVAEGVATVDVSEGLVEVATPDGAHRADVQPGFTGYVRGGQRDMVVVAPTTDGSIPGATPNDGGGKSKTDPTRTYNETSNTKGPVVITAAIGEVALDVKAVSQGLASAPAPANSHAVAMNTTISNGKESGTDRASNGNGDAAPDLGPPDFAGNGNGNNGNGNGNGGPASDLGTPDLGNGNGKGKAKGNGNGNGNGNSGS